MGQLDKKVDAHELLVDLLVKGQLFKGEIEMLVGKISVEDIEDQLEKFLTEAGYYAWGTCDDCGQFIPDGEQLQCKICHDWFCEHCISDAVCDSCTMSLEEMDHEIDEGDYIAINEQWVVFDRGSYYEIGNRKTGQTAAMSDGVDWQHDAHGKALIPGTDAFEQAVQRWIDTNKEIEAAYFGEKDA